MPLSKCNCEGCELKSLFFENVTTLEIEAMCTRKVEAKHSRGAFILREGEPIHDFTYLKSGLVKLFKGNADGSEQIICFAGPLDFVSLLSVFSETHYNYSVVALDDSVTCSISLEEIKQIATSNGLFALGIMEKVNKASDKVIQTLLEIKQRRLLSRIAYILLYFSESVYQSSTFELPVSRKEIAEFIGMTTENVIRTLSELRKDKIVKINGKEIEISDIVRLKRISDFS